MQNRSQSFDRSLPEGDDGDSTPLGHRSRSPFLTGPGKPSAVTGSPHWHGLMYVISVLHAVCVRGGR